MFAGSLSPSDLALPGVPRWAVIEGARRRQRQRRRRRVVIAGVAAAVGLASAWLVTERQLPASPSSAASLLARPLHLPRLLPGGACPTTSGYTVNNAYFAGTAVGRGPVRVLLGDRGDIRAGRVQIPAAGGRSWRGIQTLWFATGYKGPFVIRAARIGGHAPIAVQSGGVGLTPGSGPLAVAAGPTINTQDGFRTVPGATWVRSPGCYGWQVDGDGFSETIVVQVSSA